MRALIALTAVILGGCTASPSVPEIPTAGSTAANTAASTAASEAPKLSEFDKALRYTRCMTENGVTTKDPVVGEMLPVFVTFGRDEQPSSFEERGKTFRAAFDKCKAQLPATWPVKEDAAQLAKERPFKDCLKRHGIEAYEADANGMVHYPVDQSYLERPEYKAAENACRKYYDDPATAGS